jgi:hypothetical protein
MTRLLLLLCWEAPLVGRSVITSPATIIGRWAGCSRIPVANHGITYPSLQRRRPFRPVLLFLKYVPPRIQNTQQKFSTMRTRRNLSKPPPPRSIIEVTNVLKVPMADPHWHPFHEPKYSPKYDHEGGIARDKDWGVSCRGGIITPI